MTVIAPALTEETPENFKAQIERLHEFTTRAHIDLSDGEFAPTFLINASQLWWPNEWIVDIHAMVARPSEHVAALINLKPHTIIFHAETSEDILPVLRQIKQAGIKAGIALLKTTVPSTVSDAIKEADHVLIFTGNLGFHGGEASLMQLEKARLIRIIKPDVEIGWDGGANAENAYSLAQGGIDVLNVGGALASAADPQDMYAKLVNEVNKQGVI